MQDHSHKLLFLGATALMCVAALYAAQVGPTLFAGSQGSAAAAVSRAVERAEARPNLVRAALPATP